MDWSATSVTEARNPATMDIDQLPADAIVQMILREDAVVVPAVNAVAAAIAELADVVVARMRRGGRLIYVGAGTSGRLGALDAAECPPTYGTDPALVVALLAGGAAAWSGAVENVEDDVEQGDRDILALDIGPADVVLGIAASGRTPYVIGAINAARARGAFVAGLACAHPSRLAEQVDLMIAPIVGPEVVTGSTRMKAGTAQKLVLNTLSTTVMIRLGHTYGNLLSDMQATNEKLRGRAARIITMAAGIEPEQARRLLQEAGGELKTALMMALSGLDPTEARTHLQAASGSVRQAAGNSSHSQLSTINYQLSTTHWFLGVDGGGSKTRALIADSAGVILGSGHAGTSNYQTVGFASAVAALGAAIDGARQSAGLPAGVRFHGACLGLAGVGRPADRALFEGWLDQQQFAERHLVVNDAELLLAAGTPEGWGIALIAGTGSICYGLARDGAMIRAGGWGYLLGDEGSGYDLALRALRLVTQTADGRADAHALLRIVLQHWRLAEPAALIPYIYSPATTRSEVAGLAAVVVEQAAAGDPDAERIMKEATADLARLVTVVAERLREPAPPIVFGGGLLGSSAALRQRVYQEVAVTLGPLSYVDEPAHGALRLACRHRKEHSA